MDPKGVNHERQAFQELGSSLDGPSLHSIGRVCFLYFQSITTTGFGQDEGFPAIRDYYPASDGTFVSPAKQNLPAARTRKVGEAVEFVH